MSTRAPRHIEERTIAEVIPIKVGLLFVGWRSGSLGVVDLRDMLDDLPVFAFLRDAQAFARVRLEEDGSAVYWIDGEGDVIDIDSDTLWMRRRPIAPAPSSARPGKRPAHEMVESA